MNSMKKALFSVALLTVAAVNATDQWGTSFFLGANVGNVAGGGLINEAGRTHRFDSDKMYGVFHTHSEYNKSFKSKDLGKFFSPINNNVFQVGDNNDSGTDSGVDVSSTFFLMNESYAADITFKPESRTFTTNLGLFVGLDEFYEGLWFDVNLPIVHNKREIKITETQTTAAANANIATGFVEDAAVTPAAYTTFVAALKGDKGCDTGCITGNMLYGKVDGSRSHTKVGNVTLALGYDFMNKENMHLGFGVSALINGNGKSDAVYMFEPSVGTGGRHGIGARLDGHYRVYEKDDAEISLYLKANVHHIFDATVLRSYDVTAHGKWSRYMLYKEWLTANLNNVGAPVTNGIVHGVNFTTLNAKVGIGAMYDVNLMAAYSNGALGVNVGYSLFGHSKEKHKSWVDSFTTKNYAALAVTVADMDTAVDHLYGTNVTINGGTSAGAASSTATATTSTVLTLASLNKDSGLQPSAMVHRVYGDVNYKWEDNEWEPHLGLGGGAELAGNNKALAQWGVHFHGGICF